ncbi:metallophosphoesterase family protein [Novosphingobium colocasiae]|uniref:metallophosphoesterase family protein n=1 Tax=Novosphingobium colocasiae TaxID=1256513 RepID=UPI0035AF30F3
MFGKAFTTGSLLRRRSPGAMLRVRDCDEAAVGPDDLSQEPFAGRAIPAGKRVYAIGDVHGCAAAFEHLLDLIARDSCGMPTRDTVIVLLGDLIDRGPASARVLHLVQLLRASGLHVDAIMGNHEEVLLNLLAARTAPLGNFFLRIGGRETLLSYGAPPELIDRLPPEAIADAAELCIPPDHIALMAGFADAVEWGEYFFTHAGIDPARDLADQDPETLRWIRGPFIDWHGRKDKTVVHGHTVMAQVGTAPGRVGIDTGAYLTGTLTALVLEQDRHWLLQTPPAD